MMSLFAFPPSSPCNLNNHPKMDGCTSLVRDLFENLPEIVSPRLLSLFGKFSFSPFLSLWTKPFMVGPPFCDFEIPCPEISRFLMTRQGTWYTLTIVSPLFFPPPPCGIQPLSAFRFALLLACRNRGLSSSFFFILTPRRIAPLLHILSHFFPPVTRAPAPSLLLPRSQTIFTDCRQDSRIFLFSWSEWLLVLPLESVLVFIFPFFPLLLSSTRSSFSSSAIRLPSHL